MLIVEFFISIAENILPSVTECHTSHAVQSGVGVAIRKVRESFFLSPFFSQRGSKLTKLSHDKNNSLV